MLVDLVATYSTWIFYKEELGREICYLATWRGCPCTDPDKEQFPVLLRDGALLCELELPTAGDVEWLPCSYQSAMGGRLM